MKRVVPMFVLTGALTLVAAQTSAGSKQAAQSSASQASTPQPQSSTTSSQSPATATERDTAPRSTTERPNVSAPGMEQTISGVLMDASCKAIASGRSDLTSMTPSTMRHDGMTGASAQSTLGETGRTRTETERRESKIRTEAGTGSSDAPMPRLTEAGRETAGPSHASGTGTSGAASPQAAQNSSASQRAASEPETMPRLTEMGKTTAGPSHASALGTTGAATNTAPPQSGNVKSTDAVEGAGAPDGSGAAPRSTPSDAAPAGAATTAGNTTVRERYRDCNVKPATTSFAIHADGQLYVLDRASNEMVQEQMRNEAFRASMSDSKDAARWMTVTVKGTATSEKVLTIRSVRK